MRAVLEDVLRTDNPLNPKYQSVYDKIKYIESNDGIVIPYNGAPELALVSVEEAPTVVPGDVDGSGTIDDDDLSYLVRYLTGKETKALGCDVDGNGDISLSDLTELVNIMMAQP